MKNVIEKKTRPFSSYVGIAFRELCAKYKVSDYDSSKFEDFVDETATDWFLRDVFSDAAKIANIKWAVKAPLAKRDAFGLLAECQRIVKRMMALKIEFDAATLKSISVNVSGRGMYSKGDEDAPFYSEAFLYNLVGKDDARTVLGSVERLAEILGVDE